MVIWDNYWNSMENIKYTDGHFQIFGARGSEKKDVFYSQQFFLKLSLIILTRNGCQRDGRAKMTRGQEGQEGDQDGGCHDDDCVTCVTSHRRVLVTSQSSSDWSRSWSDRWSMNVLPKQTLQTAPPGYWWSVEPVISVCDNAIQAANAMSHVSTQLPSTLQNSRIRVRLKISLF